MCVMCAAFSAMTLFSPVTEAPQPANVNSANVPSTQVRQVKSMPVAEETRISITELLKQMPNSPETRVLRDEFKSIQARLAGVKDDGKAQAIVDDGLNALTKRVMAEPNSDQILGVMNSMLIIESPQLTTPAKSNLLQGPSSNLQSFKGQGGSWGWLS